MLLEPVVKMNVIPILFCCSKSHEKYLCHFSIRLKWFNQILRNVGPLSVEAPHPDPSPKPTLESSLKTELSQVASVTLKSSALALGMFGSL